MHQFSEIVHSFFLLFAISLLSLSLLVLSISPLALKYLTLTRHQQADLERQVQADLTNLSGRMKAEFASQLHELSERIESLENLLDSKLTQLGKKLQKIKHYLQDRPKSSRKGSSHHVVGGSDSDTETPSNVGTFKICFIGRIKVAFSILVCRITQIHKFLPFSQLHRRFD